MVSRQVALETLKTTQCVVAGLRALPERDEPIDRLIDSLTDARAQLLTSLLCVSWRQPPRLKSTVGVS